MFSFDFDYEARTSLLLLCVLRCYGKFGVVVLSLVDRLSLDMTFD
jgi:hypothetical protein